MLRFLWFDHNRRHFLRISLRDMHRRDLLLWDRAQPLSEKRRIVTPRDAYEFLDKKPDLSANPNALVVSFIFF